MLFYEISKAFKSFAMPFVFKVHRLVVWTRMHMTLFIKSLKILFQIKLKGKWVLIFDIYVLCAIIDGLHSVA